MSLWQAFAGAVAAQRGHLFIWSPVFLGAGIGLYFALGWEPAPRHYAAAAVLGAVAVVAATRAGETMAPLCAALALVVGGALLAGVRAHQQAAPVLDFRYYGPVEGRVVAVDRSVSDALRVTLDRVVLLRVAPGDTPHRVRVSLHGDRAGVDPVPGLRVTVTAHLSPPSGAVEPHGFDFRRHAWFQRIGAVGYARTPLMAVAPPAATEPLAALDRFRLRLAGAVRASLPGQRGAFAAAVTTGDRSALSRDTLDAMRDTNLAHLLAISGLHVGLLTGFVFMAVRIALALVPPLALRWPGKKIAAIVALGAAALYLALSGGSVSTQRAFVMVAVMLAAVLLDRRALTLRSVALAALLVLVLRPEALLGPGFQMSFAATTALVWVFGLMRDSPARRVPRWAAGLVGLVVSSAVAGLATGPFGAAHFNQSATYGLLANLAAVPVMGSVVIPSAVLAAALAPFGGAAIGLWTMGLGIDWILGVAHAVADWPGAVRYIPKPGPAVLPLICIGAIWGILWQGRARCAGPVTMAVAVALWATGSRPDILISETGGLVGIATPEGRALSRARGAGFVAMSWLENDGDAPDRDAAHARTDALRRQGALWAADGRVAILFGAETDAIERICATAALIVVNRAVAPPPNCRVIGPDALADTGAVAVWTSGRTRVKTTHSVTGNRLWTLAGRSPAAGETSLGVVSKLAAALGAPVPERTARASAGQ